MRSFSGFLCESDDIDLESAHRRALNKLADPENTTPLRDVQYYPKRMARARMDIRLVDNPRVANKLSHESVSAIASRGSYTALESLSRSPREGTQHAVLDHIDSLPDTLNIRAYDHILENLRSRAHDSIRRRMGDWK